jgi:hypothetical protein
VPGQNSQAAEEIRDGCTMPQTITKTSRWQFLEAFDGEAGGIFM